ncbi:unnamed protein product [Camellia sinensis]
MSLSKYQTRLSLSLSQLGTYIKPNTTPVFGSRFNHLHFLSLQVSQSWPHLYLSLSLKPFSLASSLTLMDLLSLPIIVSLSLSPPFETIEGGNESERGTKGDGRSEEIEMGE